GQRAEEAQAPAEEETVSARASRPRRKAADGTRDSGAAQAAALYALDEKQDTGPIARRAEARVAGPSGGEGPAPENSARVVGDRQAAFQSCVEQELRRNPRFRGGRVGLTVTVNGSGAVSAAELDRRDLQGMPVGDCITGTAKKIIFASFQGDPVQLVIPLVLTRVNSASGLTRVSSGPERHAGERSRGLHPKVPSRSRLLPRLSGSSVEVEAAGPGGTTQCALPRTAGLGRLPIHHAPDEVDHIPFAGVGRQQ